MQIQEEEVRLQEDSQGEDFLVGDHQEEDHPLHHQFRCKALTSLWVTHLTYSQETGLSLKNSSHNGRCTKESTSLIT
jgi:hypothetical protein